VKTTTAPAETLFNIGLELEALDRMLTDSMGELTPEIEAALAALDAKLTSKIDGLGWFIRTCETRAAGFKASADEMASKARTEGNKVKRLMEYVRAYLTFRKERTISGRAYTFALQTNGGKRPLTLHNENPEAFPASCVKVVKVIDKDAVRAMVEAGTLSAELATLEPVGEHIRLR
jgi:Gp157 protein